MKFTNFVILNIAIITNVLAVRRKQGKNGFKLSTYGGNQNQNGQKQNQKIHEVNKKDKAPKNKGVSTNNKLKQNGVESLSSLTNIDGKSDNNERLEENDNEILDTDKNNTSKLVNALPIEDINNIETKDTTESTLPNVVQSSLADDQEENEMSDPSDNLNDKEVYSLDSTKVTDKTTEKKLDDSESSSGVIETPTESETDNDTNNLEPSIKSISDQKVTPVEEQNVDKTEKVEDGAANFTKQFEIVYKEYPINTKTPDPKPAEEASDNTKATIPKTSPPTEEALDNTKATISKTSTPTEEAPDNNKTTIPKTSTPTEEALDNNNATIPKTSTPTEEALDNNNATIPKTSTPAEEASDNNKGDNNEKTSKADTPASNVGNKSAEITNTGGPTTSETTKINPTPLSDSPQNDPKPKNNHSGENKKSDSSKLGKYILWGLLGVCVVGLTVCMILLVSSK